MWKKEREKITWLSGYNTLEDCRKKPDFTEAYVWLGDLYLEKGNQDKALKAYKKVIELDPNSELGLYALDGIDRAKEYLDEDAENTDAEKTP